jgi:hypothetical protein
MISKAIVRLLRCQHGWMKERYKMMAEGDDYEPAEAFPVTSFTMMVTMS